MVDGSSGAGCIRRRAPRVPLAPWRGDLPRGLAEVLDERVQQAGDSAAVDLVEAAVLYQTLDWVARTAAVPTPETDVLLVAAAGWAAIPASSTRRWTTRR